MKKRVISAAIAIGLVIPIFIFGGILLQVAVALLAAVAYFELSILNESHKPYPMPIKIIGLLCLEFLVLFRSNPSYIYYGLPFLCLGVMGLVLTIPTIFNKSGSYTTKEAFYLLGTITFIGTFFNLLILIYSASKWLLLYLLLVAILTDTFAMLIGCLIGKHKLIPKVSPKKSIEGTIAGSIVGTIVPSIFYYYVVTPNINIILLLLISLILSILGQIGDLFFSKIKRENQVKDFSNIMPGHGGVLDRLDSLSFVILGYTIIINIVYLFK